MATFENSISASPPSSSGHPAPAAAGEAAALLSVPGPPLCAEELSGILAERWARYLRDPSTARDGREVIADMRAANAAGRTRRDGR